MICDGSLAIFLSYLPIFIMEVLQLPSRSSRPEVYRKKVGFRPATLLKKGLWRKRFLVNFVKFLNFGNFLKTHLRLFLTFSSQSAKKVRQMCMKNSLSKVIIQTKKINKAFNVLLSCFVMLAFQLSLFTSYISLDTVVHSDNI